MAIITLVCAIPRNTGDAVGMERESADEVGWRKPVLISLLVFCLVMPSDWTQDVPERYGKRHPGLIHSTIYPNLSTDPTSAQ